MRAYQQTAPLSIGLINEPWFYTPPFQPSDKTTRAATPPAANYRLAIVGFDAGKLRHEKPEVFVLSEYEWMEKQRLNDSAWRDFQKSLNRDYVLAQTFNSLRLGPRRTYEPHDYLYTHPEIRVYKRRAS